MYFFPQWSPNLHSSLRLGTISPLLLLLPSVDSCCLLLDVGYWSSWASGLSQASLICRPPVSGICEWDFLRPAFPSPCYKYCLMYLGWLGWKILASSYKQQTSASLVFLFCFEVLRMESRALCMLDKRSATWLPA